MCICVDVHGFGLYSRPFSFGGKGIETHMSLLKEQTSSSADIVTACKISLVNQNSVRKYREASCSASYFCFSVHIYSTICFIETRFPCFPWFSRALGFIFLLLKVDQTKAGILQPQFQIPYGKYLLISLLTGLSIVKAIFLNN